MAAEPTFFESADDWGQWLEHNHDRADELLLGFWKTKIKREGMTYKEALDMALCYGWIDGVRKSLADESYTIRFTQRRKTSIWSQVNLRRYKELLKEGRVQPCGRAIHDNRDPAKENLYSFEVKKELEGEELAEFERHEEAFAFWQAQPPGYRRLASWWVLQAKREETRKRRLATLIGHCANGERLPDPFAKKKA